jgi:hypothetical protein
MTPSLASRQANVAHNANEASTGHQDTETLSPSFREFGEKLLIVGNVAELGRVFAVPLQCPIWR